MNQTLQQLFEVASKKDKQIIGLMSGTSLDGLDIALCKVQGKGPETRLTLQKFKTVPYPPDVRKKLEKLISVSSVDLKELCLANTWLADYHADLILEVLRDWKVEPAEIDVIASHGQTVYHAPVIQHENEGIANTTFQIGDGDHIARKTGILTVSDFRQKHTAAGGEGAPLVPYADELLFRTSRENRVLLNIGGIANYTFLPADSSKDISYADTGPGNTLINAAMQKYFGRGMDKDGKVASSGKVDPELLKSMLAHPYLQKPAPKSTGPEVFNLHWLSEIQNESDTGNIAPEDLIATLTWFSAQTIADGLRKITREEEAKDKTLAIYLSGGGMYNNRMMQWLKELLERAQLNSFEDIGYEPDAKEAVSFTILANEALSGSAFMMNPKQNVGRRVNFGKISLPV